MQFNLELVLQAVDRAGACDEVWLAAAMSARGKGREHDSRFRALCRRLGFGLLGVTPRGEVELLLSPAAPPPRRDPRMRSRLVDEHRRRRGDPAVGGSTRSPVMTAYRQDALACAAAMAEGPKRPRDLKGFTPRAGKILLDNVYGWFDRAERGVYVLTDAGHAALLRWPQSDRRLPGLSRSPRTISPISRHVLLEAAGNEDVEQRGRASVRLAKSCVTPAGMTIVLPAGASIHRVADQHRHRALRDAEDLVVRLMECAPGRRFSAPATIPTSSSVAVSSPSAWNTARMTGILYRGLRRQANDRSTVACSSPR